MRYCGSNMTVAKAKVRSVYQGLVRPEFISLQFNEEDMPNCIVGDRLVYDGRYYKVWRICTTNNQIKTRFDCMA